VGYDPKAGRWYITVSAGSRLSDIAQYLDEGSYAYHANVQSAAAMTAALYFPVNPTEMTAQVGGILASNASGARSYYYGPVRDWVRRLRVILSDGTELEILRGDIREHNGFYQLNKDIRIPSAKIDYPKTKRTLGYMLAPGGDAIDLFIGSECTLGLISDAYLYLIPPPKNTLGQIVFIEDETKLLDLVHAFKKNDQLKVVAIEYYDEHAVSILRQSDDHQKYLKQARGALGCALYIETIYDNDQELDICFETCEKLLTANGISIDNTWAAFDHPSLEKMAELRHYVPETVNRIISERKKVYPDLRKVSSDMAVPDESLNHILSFYRNNLVSAGIEYVIFGHIGDGHLHVNMLPRNPDDFDKAQDIYTCFAQEVIRCGGAVAAEHGIGRLKKKYLRMQFAPEILQAMGKVKKILDPKGIFNPGVLFEE
jgi:D-lactate dehydrogenase (cytochrome)